MSRKIFALIGSVLNEEAALPAFLEAHAWADDIIMLDSGSTDNSAEVTRKYKRTLLHKPLEANHNKRSAWAIQQTIADWVLFIDPDEFISAELKKEILSILEHGSEYVAFELPRVNFFMNKPLRHGGWSGNGLKMFRRDKVRFEGDSYHERPIIDGKIGQLKGEVLHYPNPNIHWITQKFNFISEFDQKDYFDQYGELSEKKLRWLLFTKPFKNFWKSYIKKQGYKDGIHGLIYAAMIWAFDVIRICKYAERYIVKNPDILPADKLPDPWECRKR
ncbi:MAG TPA: glycosyltransferase family 2 protein [Candidatus Omnitrophota bacterium]|nr:glycosyltransferase family 2 protein [Candidatus Omnitrophota bacterium]HSA31444.1 glycosyltransferase family 2 protein [Candidatus Omnitrophota bacterium]